MNNNKIIGMSLQTHTNNFMGRQYSIFICYIISVNT